MFHFRNQEAKVPAPGKPHWDTHIYSYDAPSLPQAEASAMYAKLAAETLLGLEWHYSRFPVWCPTLLENVIINGNISLACVFLELDYVYLSCCFIILSEPSVRAKHILQVAFVVCSAHPEGTSSITGSQPTINMSSGALDGSDLSVARISILSIRWHSCWEARNSTKFTTGLGWNSSTFLSANGSCPWVHRFCQLRLLLKT